MELNKILLLQFILENIFLLVSLPTLGILPAVIIFGIYGRTTGNYTKIKRFAKWWLISIVPMIIIYISIVLTQFWFLKNIGEL